MRLVHVVPQIAQEASGPSYSVPRLCQSLADCGNEVELKCIAARGDIQGVEVSTHAAWPVLKRFEVSTALARALQRDVKNVDIVHNHSLWSMVNVAAGWVVPGRHAKLVTSPRGTLSEWALSRSRPLKRVLWPLQRRALERADLLHATSEAEYREIRNLGLQAPVAIIPNGIDLPVLPASRPGAAMKTLLFLSRIHPKKGLDLLLQAWCRLQHQHTQWQLVIAGRGEPEHEHAVKQLAKTLDLVRVKFPGPLYGTDKSRAYFDASLFVLPTHSENFGLVVAEALAHGCAAVVSQGAPWAGLETEGCGWWIENEIDELTRAMDAAMCMDAGKLETMGAKGRDWMGRDYSWPVVGRQMDAAYRWLLKDGVLPAFVRPM